MAKTRRSPDGIFASVGAVNQTGGPLPIYICNGCERDVVWAESKRTGRKYLANVGRAQNGGRFYIAASLHKCPADVAPVERVAPDYVIKWAKAAEIARRGEDAEMLKEAVKGLAWAMDDAGVDHINENWLEGLFA